jgi:hypothetical protein
MPYPRPSAAGIAFRFREEEWRQEVERLRDRSAARMHGEDGTRLLGCIKLYVPLARRGASESPFGFVFQLAEDSDGSISWNFIAFGERHPETPRLAPSMSAPTGVCTAGIPDARLRDLAG